jgi:hypothetical protein
MQVEVMTSLELETGCTLELDSTGCTLELDSAELEDSTLELDSGSEELDSGTSLELDSTELEDTGSSPQEVSLHHHVWFASSLIHSGTPSLTRSLFMV